MLNSVNRGAPAAAAAVGPRAWQAARRRRRTGAPASPRAPRPRRPAAAAAGAERQPYGRGTGPAPRRRAAGAAGASPPGARASRVGCTVGYRVERHHLARVRRLGYRVGAPPPGARARARRSAPPACRGRPRSLPVRATSLHVPRCSSARGSATWSAFLPQQADNCLSAQLQSSAHVGVARRCRRAWADSATHPRVLSTPRRPSPYPTPEPQGRAFRCTSSATAHSSAQCCSGAAPRRGARHSSAYAVWYVFTAVAQSARNSASAAACAVRQAGPCGCPAASAPSATGVDRCAPVRRCAPARGRDDS